MSLAIVGGTLYFDRFDATGAKTGERKIASTQAINFSQTPQKLGSYNNDNSAAGVKEEEDIVRVDRSLAFATRSIVGANLALVLGGSEAIRTQAGGALAETLSNVTPGMVYQLGVTAAQPSGSRNITGEAITVAAAAKTAGVDYLLDETLGRLEILETGTIVKTDDVDVAATIGATTWEYITSATQQIQGAARLIGVDSKGNHRDYYFPKCNLAVDGEFLLKGDPENPAYQEIPISLEILEDVANGLAAVYLDGRPQS